jgi:hypothetical protein
LTEKTPEVAHPLFVRPHGSIIALSAVPGRSVALKRERENWVSLKSVCTVCCGRVSRNEGGRDNYGYGNSDAQLTVRSAITLDLREGIDAFRL